MNFTIYNLGLIKQNDTYVGKQMMNGIKLKVALEIKYKQYKNYSSRTSEDSK